MKKIIVTGGAGYIGSHTVVELNNAGFEPIIIDNLCNSSEKNINGIQEIIGKKVCWHNIDCCDPNAMNEVLKQEKEISGIIHFAAYKSVEESMREPEKYYTNNVESIKVLLKLMREQKINNLVFSSSCTVYGNPDYLPVDEKAQFKKAESPYGETKQLCEILISKSKINSVSLRYFNPIGSHQSTLIGDCSKDKPANLVPIITETVIGKRKEMTIYGNDYDTHDGTCIRDYIHVVDLAKSHVNALNYVIENNGKHTFNIGTGKGISVMEAIHSFEKANKLKVNYKIGVRRDGDVIQIYADNRLSEKELKWKAEINLEQAMIDAWNWEKNK